MKTLKIIAVGASVAVVAWLIGCGTVTQGGGAPNEEAVEAEAEGSAVPPVKDMGGGAVDGDKVDGAEVGGPCAADADCVPAECCHAKNCTSKDNAPDCSDMMCTLDCRAGTMDCGWGKCVCQDGQCTAEINPPPKPPIKADPKMGVKPLPE
jgi:hypothetical protein